MATTTRAKLPPQIPYIIGTEGCERFSFYGMRNILTPFLVTSFFMHLPEFERGGAAKDVFHTFVIGVYFFPLLGGWLSDRFWGKYKTTLYLSLVYCIGHFCLAMFEGDRLGFYTGLALIALGSGGIKPCVSAFVGDQFDETNKHLAKGVYDAFYWIINFGSFFASLLMPIFLKQYGASVAFGIPGILMLISTLIFWTGRKKYVFVPPTAADPHSFFQVAKTAVLTKVTGKANTGLLLASLGGLGAVVCFGLIPFIGFVSSFCLALVSLLSLGGWGAWLQADRARTQHGDQAVEAMKAVLRLLIVFALVTPFWSLFDQKASTWVLQAGDMIKPSWFQPAQMQALNPILVMILIPLNNFIFFPFFRRWGIEPTPLRRMTTGIILSGISWVIVGMMQLAIDQGSAVSIVWQVLPYAFLTAGEVLVSATGLEFAYSQAPKSMKGVLMSFWLLAVTIGNLWVLLSNTAVRNESMMAFIATTGISVKAFQMFFFAGFALLTAVAFGLYASKYRMVDNYRSNAEKGQSKYRIKIT